MPDELAQKRQGDLPALVKRMVEAKPDEYEGILVEALRDIVASHRRGRAYGRTVDQVGRLLLAYDTGQDLASIDAEIDQAMSNG